MVVYVVWFCLAAFSEFWRSSGAYTHDTFIIIHGPTCSACSVMAGFTTGRPVQFILSRIYVKLSTTSNTDDHIRPTSSYPRPTQPMPTQAKHQKDPIPIPSMVNQPNPPPPPLNKTHARTRGKGEERRGGEGDDIVTGALEGQHQGEGGEGGERGVVLVYERELLGGVLAAGGEGVW